MPSFDVVSQLDLQEVENAVNQSKKEIDNRYDFRGSKASIDWDKKENITLVAEDKMKVEALKTTLQQKLAKRGLGLKAFEFSPIEDSGGMLKKISIRARQGISTEDGKKIVKVIKEQKLKKVQAQIQNDQVRVSGPKRDDLQNAIQVIKDNIDNLELQFVNFRD